YHAADAATELRRPRRVPGGQVFGATWVQLLVLDEQLRVGFTLGVVGGDATVRCILVVELSPDLTTSGHLKRRVVPGAGLLLVHILAQFRSGNDTVLIHADLLARATVVRGHVQPPADHVPGRGDLQREQVPTIRRGRDHRPADFVQLALIR